MASDRFPLAGHRYNPVIMAVFGLVRLDLNYSFILSHDILNYLPLDYLF